MKGFVIMQYDADVGGYEAHGRAGFESWQPVKFFKTNESASRWIANIGRRWVDIFIDKYNTTPQQEELQETFRAGDVPWDCEWGAFATVEQVIKLFSIVELR